MRIQSVRRRSNCEGGGNEGNKDRGGDENDVIEVNTMSSWGEGSSIVRFRRIGWRSNKFGSDFVEPELKRSFLDSRVGALKSD